MERKSFPCSPAPSVSLFSYFLPFFPCSVYLYDGAGSSLWCMGSWLWHATTTDPHAISGEVHMPICRPTNSAQGFPTFVICVLCDDSYSGMCRGYLTAGFGVVGFWFFFFLAELDLLCCTWAFSSCGEWGLLFVAVCGLLIVVASLDARVWALGHKLNSCGARSQLLCGMWNLNSPTRDQTRIPCIGRCILNHWTSREFPALALFLSTMAFLQIYVSSHIHLCMYQYGASQLSPW